MISIFSTRRKNYQLKVDKFSCNKFGISEFLVSTVDNNGSYSNLKVLDVGCGVGPLGIYFADQRNCIVTGIEISTIACSCCAENISTLGLLSNFKLVNVDFCSYCEHNLADDFDLIVSNPPIDDNVSLDEIRKYQNLSRINIQNSRTFSYVTNSWHASSGRDLVDYIFLYGGNLLTNNGRIIIAFCELSCPDLSKIKKRGGLYGFSLIDVKKKKIPPQRVGAKRNGLISVVCMVFKRDI